MTEIDSLLKNEALSLADRHALCQMLCDQPISKQLTIKAQDAALEMLLDELFGEERRAKIWDLLQAASDKSQAQQAIKLAIEKWGGPSKSEGETTVAKSSAKKAAPAAKKSAPPAKKAAPAARKAVAPKVNGAKVAKANGEGKRKSRLAGKTLRPLVDSNPRKAGSHGHKSLEIILNKPGISTEAFVAAGGRIVDLNWDIERKHVKAE